MTEDEKTAERSIGELSLGELHKNFIILEYQAQRIKIEAAQITGEIHNRLAASAGRAYEQAGKEHGTLSMPLQDGLTAKCDIGKKIEWDSAKLQAIAQTLPWARVCAIFKIAFAIPETTYKGIAAVAPDLRAQIDEARTVKLAPVKITLVRDAV